MCSLIFCNSTCNQLWLVIRSVPYHCPGDSRRLVGHRHRGNIRVASRSDTRDPLAQSVIFRFGCPDHRASTVNEQTSHIGVASLTNSPKPLFTSRTVLFG